MIGVKETLLTRASKTTKDLMPIINIMYNRNYEKKGEIYLSFLLFD
jgi:hypothetical protein